MFLTQCIQIPKKIGNDNPGINYLSLITRDYRVHRVHKHKVVLIFLFFINNTYYTVTRI